MAQFSDSYQSTKVEKVKMKEKTNQSKKLIQTDPLNLVNLNPMNTAKHQVTKTTLRQKIMQQELRN